MAEQVMHGALGVVKRNGEVIGHMRSVRWGENIRRGEVQGIGTVLLKEAPVLQSVGQLSCDFYDIDFGTTGIPRAIRRDVQTEQQFEDNLLLDEGLTIDIFKKVEDVVDDNGIFRAKLNPYAIIRKVFINSDSSDITEGALSTHSQGFIYLSPVIYPE